MAGYIGSKGSGIISGIDASIADLNLTDKASANGTTEANKVLTADGNKDVTAIRNLTVTGDVTATGTVTRALTRGSIDVGNSSGVSYALAKGATGTVLTSDGTDLSWGAAGGFKYNAVSGASQALDIGSYNFFNAGTISADTTLSFSNVPTQALWTYTARMDLFDGYDISATAYDSVSYDASAQTSNFGRAVAFKTDGTKMYVNSNASGSSAIVYQYSLSTPWNVSTASYDSKSYNSTSTNSQAWNLYFKPDGTKLFLVAATSGQSTSIFEHALSTAWDISTASYSSRSYNLANQGVSAYGVHFKPDGKVLWSTTGNDSQIFQYNLSTAWDISTISYNSTFMKFDATGNANCFQGIVFSSDGKIMVLAAYNEVYRYDLSVPFLLSSAVYGGENKTLSSTVGSNTMMSATFKTDGSKMYIPTSSGTVYQFSTGTGYSLTLPTSVQNAVTVNSAAGETLALDFYTADSGSNVYIIGQDVN